MQDLRQALAAIRAIAVASQGDYALPDLLRQVCSEVATTFRFNRVAIARLQAGAEGDVAVIRATVGIDEGEAAAVMSIAETPAFAKACESRAVVYVADAREEAALPRELVDSLGVTSLFVLPLLSRGRCMGVVAGDRGGTPFHLDDTEVDLLNTVGVITATLLEKELLREEMRRVDAAKTQFIAFASHELRTPIQTVYGVLATLHRRGSELAEEQRVHLRAVAFAQADRLRTLVDQLLDLSRIDAAALSLAPERIHVRSLLEEIVLVVAEREASAVEVAAPDDLEAPLDRAAIERVVSNLLANALRYGEPPVSVEAEQVDGELRIRIADSGAGIAPDFVPQLFERFTRSDASADLAQGSGLGLAIARAYARAHGGEVVYRPRQPRGACFELVVPAEAA